MEDLTSQEFGALCDRILAWLVSRGVTVRVVGNPDLGFVTVATSEGEL